MLITTKLYIPRPKPNAILRPRLFDMLRRSLDRKLITIVAMAGAGKTTLLAQAVAQLRLPAVYLSLDESDGELAVLFEYLAVGLIRYLRAEERSALTRTLERELNDLVESVKRQPDPEMAAVRLINIMARHRTRDLYFILDDYHVIARESLAQRFLEFFLARVPPTIHFIIASRAAVGFSGLPQWAAKQEVTELNAADLALAKEEAETLVSSGYGANLSSEEFNDLLERSQGWVTGIHLIMQAAGMHKSLKETLNGYLAANRPLFDYFAAEIYSREDERYKCFLQKVSILDDLDPRACDYLTERNDAATILAALERQNTFVTKNASGTFVLHPLFRTFLQGSIENRNSLEAWHRRAAAYYESIGNIPAVIDHAVAGRDHRRAAQMLADIYDQLKDATQFSRLARWLKNLPEIVYGEWPRLLLAKARWLKEENDVAGQLRAIEGAVSLLRRKRDRTGYCWALNDLAGFRRQTDIAEAMRIAQKALRHCPSSDRLLRGVLLNTIVCLQVHLGKYIKAEVNLARALKLVSPDVSLYIWLRHNQGALHIYRGDNLKAIRIYQDTLSRIDGGSLEPETIAIFYAAFRAALEAGDLVQAKEFMEQGRRLCQPLWNASSQLIDAEASAFLQFHLGQQRQSLRMLDDVAKRYRQLHNDNRALKIEVKEVRFYRQAGMAKEAEAILDSIEARTRMVDWSPTPADKLEVLFNRGMLRAGQGRGAEAIRMADEVLEYSRKIACRQGLFYHHLLRAKGERKEEEARRHFIMALECSHRYGYHGLLSLEMMADPEMARLIKGIPGKKYSLYLIKRLLQTTAGKSPKGEGGGIRVRLLGTMELLDDAGKPMVFKWRTRKVESLFAYLLLQKGRYCHREELIEALWPGIPLGKAQKKLYHSVFHLKKTLSNFIDRAGEPLSPMGEVVQHQSQSYRINPGIKIELDVEELVQIRNRIASSPDDKGIEECLKAGMDLYRDAFVPELSELWCEKQRERFQGMFIFIAEKYARLCQQKGQWEPALAAYQRMLQYEPLADQARIQCWNVLKQLGRETAIRRDYGEYKLFLKREYGEVPSDNLRAAYVALSC